MSYNTYFVFCKIYFKIREIVVFKSVSANTNPAFLSLSGTAYWPPEIN